MVEVSGQSNVGRERERAFDHLVSRQERRRLGLLLREARVEVGLKQVDLAERLGVPRAVLSKMEGGHRAVEVLELRAVCTALGLTLEAFARRLDDALTGPG
jgi:transcriptional regulator with XRE-family HTH domain